MHKKSFLFSLTLVLLCLAVYSPSAQIKKKAIKTLEKAMEEKKG